MKDLHTSTVSGAAAFERAHSEGLVDDDLPTPAELAEDAEQTRAERTYRAYVEEHSRIDALVDGWGEPGDYEEDEAA